MEMKTNHKLDTRLENFSELKVLGVLESVSYLTGLSERLKQLSKIFQRESDEFLPPYIGIIHNSIKALILKHYLSKDDKIDFDLTIAAKDSGFPTEKDFYLLERNQREAENVLEILPSRDEIIDMIRRNILRGSSISNPQIMLRRHNFYSLINQATLLKGYHLNEPKLVKEENGRRLYTLEWSCIERASMLPVLYKMYLTQDQRKIPLESSLNTRLETMIYSTQLGFCDIGTFARTIDNEIDELHPKLLEKYTIGPYYNNWTINSPETFNLLDEEENYLLKFSIERVLSERVKAYGDWLDYLLRRKTEREIFGPVDFETKIVVPFRMKQKLGNKDEYGNPCKVYGITKGGDIVG